MLKRTIFMIKASLIAASLLSTGVLAAQTPRGLATDARIKVINFDANNIVSLHGSHLIATAVTLSKQEQILSIDTGDKLAWDIHVNKQIPYRFTLKPLLPTSVTNLTVTTTKRTYLFQLIASPNDSLSNATYAVNFTYPEEQKPALNNSQTDFAGIFSGDAKNVSSLNLNYSFVGSRFIAPIQAGDNGTFTVFVFSKNHPIPAIFGVDNNGNESLLNYHTQGDKVFIQGIRHQYTLRNGDDVTTVYNDNMKV
ncbi:MAG: Type IV secretion system protein virB9 [Legionellaceae bacterium]